MSMIHIAGLNSSSKLSELDNNMVSPNAVDLRLGKVLKINDDVFTIDEEHKIHRGSQPFEPWTDGYYYLVPGSYEVVMESDVTVGPDEAGFIITRSTLNRNGVFLTSGLYDSGYDGVLAGVLHVNCGLMRIKPGTRIGQYLCWKAEAIGSYDGSYGHGKQHDKKYR